MDDAGEDDYDYDDHKEDEYGCGSGDDDSCRMVMLQ